MKNLISEITTKTFMTMDSDDWFIMMIAMIVGIGLVLLLATTFNTLTRRA